MTNILIFNTPNIILDDIVEQIENIEVISKENRTPYGTLIVNNQATKGNWELTSVPISFAKYASIQGYLRAMLYSPVSIYFDHIGGNINAQVTISAQRIYANGSASYQICSIKIKEV